MKTICCVLKSGGDFDPSHVEWLRRQCAEKMPGWLFQCWSDMDVPGCIPLRYGWPKWWSKIEILATVFKGPALVVDLDTVFVGELKIQPDHEDKAIFLRNPWKDGFRKPEQLGGGFTYLPSWARAWILANWDESVIDRYGGDDQPFYHDLFSKTALRWQDHYIDQVVSYKAQVKRLGLNSDNKVIFYHGVPRPWDTSDSWIPSLPTEAKQPSQEFV